MLKIDSHQHFWLYDKARHEWINEDMHQCRRDFVPADLQPLLEQNGIAGCVTVQADQTITENEFILNFAQQNSFIKGVVGWIDLKAADVEQRLEQYRDIELMKGFRHVLQGEADDRYMLREDFMTGIGLLDKYGFTYDILIFPKHLKIAAEFVAAFPNQRFVVDHLAKPFIKAGDIDQWKKDIQVLAQHQNVSCKVSGMVTEADWNNWKDEDFTPYLDIVFNAFGAERLMYGSDWPVCNVAGGYQKAYKLAEGYVNQLSQNEQELFWAKNAIHFYRLKV
ncbi:amidohydrolase family protein [Mucilaginibacter achroorhodeus]|uniref:Amidohydrolase family protein n=1 Tax=Mucilaginibacter achroorhodeus TaxID=2599294 RepID=A0A563TZV7_9SPHI|nr:amidohydrolase family protein [Mucilaginibacter achroorhodeus]TWR24914.1 amidohydrolase family protein [Mucilaginibacter achroorhodeus]